MAMDKVTHFFLFLHETALLALIALSLSRLQKEVGGFEDLLNS